jgi:predicted DNA-binding transcriptional regulator YafY
MQLDSPVRASDVSFNEGLLRLAAVHGRKVEFRYAKTDTAPIEYRSFVPEAVHHTREGNTVVVGPDDDRAGEYRSYRLDRIKGEVTL